MHADIGRHGKDRLTGFEGIITGYCQYMTGCDQFLIQPKAKSKDYVQPLWFDEQRLIISGKAVALDNSNGNGACGVAPIK